MSVVESSVGAGRTWGGAAVAERGRLLTFRRGVAGLILLMWLVPMKLYRLPVQLPFNLEPYRLYLLALMGAIAIAVLVGRLRITAAGHGRALVMLGVAALGAQLANWSAIQAAESGQSVKALSYFVSVLVAFVVVATAVETREDAEALIRVLVAGAAIVALAAVYEAHRKYNVFQHLHSVVPFLDYLGRGQAKLRFGNVRVRASAQDPIALGVVLAMAVPLGVYVSSKARTTTAKRIWLLATCVMAAGAFATVSRTVVLAFFGMLVAGLILRKREVRRRWPVLIVLAVIIHVASPGAISHLYRAFNPKKGLLNQQVTRSGERGSGRLADFAPGLQFWSKSPVFGYGLGTGAASDQPGQSVGRVLESGGAPVIFDDQYLSSLVGLGLVGLIGVIWVVWGAVVKLGKSAKRLGADADVLAACAVSCACYGVGMATLDTFSFVQCTFMFFVVAAIGLKARALIEGAEAPAGRATAVAIPAARRVPVRVPAPVPVAAAVAAPAPAPPRLRVAPRTGAMRTDLGSGAGAMARGALVNLAGSVGANVLSFAATITVAHIVAPSAIGLAAIGATMAGLVVVPAILGLDTGIVRFVALAAAAKDETRARAAFQAAVASTTIVSAILVFVVLHEASWLSAHYFHKPQAVTVLRISAWSVPALALARLAVAATQGFGLMGPGAWLGVVRQVVNVAAVVPLVAAGLGARGIAVAAVVTAWVACLVAFGFVVRAHPRAFVPTSHWPIFRLLNFSIPQLLTATMFFVLVWTDTLLLARYEHSAVVGVYSIVGQLLVPATLISTAVGQMFAPRVAVQDARGDRQALSTILKRVTHWNTTVSLPVFTVLAVAPVPLLELFGHRYATGATALVILSLGQLANTAAGPVGQVLNMSGRQYITLTNNAVTAGLNVLGCLLLIPRYGMTGAAISSASALTLVNLVKLAQVRLIFGVHPFRSDSGRALVAAAGAGAAVLLTTRFVPWPTTQVEAVASLLIVSVAYAAALYVLGLSDEDRTLIAAAWKRVAPSRYRREQGGNG